jgi:glucosylceramidase
MIEQGGNKPQLVSSDSTSQWQRTELSESRVNVQADLELTGERQQLIEGFGGCFNELGWIALSGTSSSSRENVLDQLFAQNGDGLRFEVGRIPIGATDYSTDWYSCNEHEGDYAMDHFSIDRDKKELLPFIQAALTRLPDMTMFASPWSPPTWMKHPKVYNYGSLTWTEQNLQAYALYLLKFVQAYANEGVNIHQLHYQNEPCTVHRFPSCAWTGKQLRDFLRDYLGPLFSKENPDVELWLGTLNSESYDEFANVVLSDEQARNFLSGVGFQWAGKQAIQRAHQTWPNMRLMQTENECGDGTNTWSYAHYVFGLLWHYMNNGANSYIYWNLVLPKGGDCTWGGQQNSLINVDTETGEVIWNPEYYLFKHLGHFVGRGSTRLALNGPWSGNALAFENTKGESVIVLNNPFDNERELSISKAGRNYTFTAAPKSFHTLVFA